MSVYLCTFPFFINSRDRAMGKFKNEGIIRKFMIFREILLFNLCPIMKIQFFLRPWWLVFIGCDASWYGKGILREKINPTGLKPPSRECFPLFLWFAFKMRLCLMKASKEMLNVCCKLRTKTFSVYTLNECCWWHVAHLWAITEIGVLNLIRINLEGLKTIAEGTYISL